MDGQANALLDETPVISSGPSMYLALFRREILGPKQTPAEQVCIATPGLGQHLLGHRLQLR